MLFWYIEALLAYSKHGVLWNVLNVEIEISIKMSTETTVVLIVDILNHIVWNDVRKYMSNWV